MHIFHKWVYYRSKSVERGFFMGEKLYRSLEWYRKCNKCGVVQESWYCNKCGVVQESYDGGNYLWVPLGRQETEIFNMKIVDLIKER